MKRSLKLILVVACLLLVSGCSFFEKTDDLEFDAAGYVQSILDIEYKGVYERYIELTDNTKEKALALYEEFIDNEANYLETYFNLTLDDALSARVREIAKKVNAKTSYSVKLDSKSDEGFKVALKMKPVLIYTNVDEINDYYDDNLADTTSTIEKSKAMVEMIEKNIDKMPYGSEITLTISVILKEKYYTIPDEDYDAIFSNIVKY